MPFFPGVPCDSRYPKLGADPALERLVRAPRGQLELAVGGQDLRRTRPWWRIGGQDPWRCECWRRRNLAQDRFQTARELPPRRAAPVMILMSTGCDRSASLQGSIKAQQNWTTGTVSYGIVADRRALASRTWPPPRRTQRGRGSSRQPRRSCYCCCRSQTLQRRAVRPE